MNDWIVKDELGMVVPATEQEFLRVSGAFMGCFWQTFSGNNPNNPKDFRVPGKKHRLICRLEETEDA